MKKILILSANPKRTDKLRLDEEVRDIELGLERSRRRDQFEIKTKWAVRWEDVRRAVMDIEPQVVHFSGHGAGKDGLAMEDAAGQMQLVTQEALSRLFKLFKDSTECVVLNACYSEVQAVAIHAHIDCVIGMRSTVQDSAAKEFAVGFYDGLGANYSYERAFDLGCSGVLNDTEADKPILLIRQPVSVSPAPLPVEVPPVGLELEEPDGMVPVESKFYVDRPPIEVDCYERIVKPGALIRIKGPRQMGKSSLMIRVLDQAQQQGYRIANVNFQRVDGEYLTGGDVFFQWFCRSVAEALDLPDRLEDTCKGSLGAKHRTTKYFEKYLLPNCEKPLVLALDEVDQVFPCEEIAKDFFGLLRAWHEQSKYDALWKKLRLVIVHSKEVYIPLDLNQSPFNVGFAVELRELNPEQVKSLVERHGLQWQESQVTALMRLLGGHPYLLRVALYQLARQRITFEQLAREAPTEGGLYGEHLRRHLLNLESEQGHGLPAAMQQVMRSDQPVQIGTTEAFKLASMGLVKYSGNAVVPLCELYRQYFSDRLV
jgi:hypothetical protein